MNGIERLSLPAATTPYDLLAAHRQKLTQFREPGGKSPVMIRTAADALALSIVSKL